MFKNIFDKLSIPFTKYGLHFISLFFLVSSVDVFFHITRHLYVYSLYLALHGFLTSYLIILTISLIPYKKVRTCAFNILFILASCFFIIDIVCNVKFHIQFSQVYAAIIIGTNPSESIEFIQTFITGNIIVTIIALMLLLLLLIYIIRHFYIVKVHKKSSYILLLLVLLSILAYIHNPSVAESVFLGKIATFSKVQSPPNLNKYLTHPNIKVDSAKSAKNLVIIIGESLSKYHCSLYGYEKETQPHLGQMRNDSLLYVFDNIEAPATNTIEAFKSIMSTYRNEYKDSIAWYECTTILELLNVAGYQTYWFSNQSKTGLFDNIVGKYADLCTYNSFVGNKFSGTERTSLDAELISLADSVKESNKLRTFFFHLMGSHEKFSERYPKSFNIYKPSDYMNKPQNQRKDLADYDNSILYNDFVVSSIINSFSDKEAIIIYFSDHALDVYQSSDDYCGHANNKHESIKYGKAIPFIVFVSPIYKEKHKDICDSIKNNQSKYFCTDNLFYTIMEIIGASSKDKELRSGLSLF